MTALPRKILHFYTDGFRSMTIGRQLWLIIAIKVIIIFGILKIFFFPDVLADKAGDGSKSEAARVEMLNRAPLPSR